MPRNSKCTDCELHKSSVNVCVWGDGPQDALIVAIGEAPGEMESKTGKPFMGKSGQLLRGELSKIGLESKVYITNVVKCRPPDNRTPTPSEMKACRKYLDEELATIKPKFVVPLGATASKALKSGAKISEIHGKLIQGENYMIAPMYHPAYALRDPSKLPAFQQDMARLSRTVNGERQEATVRWAIVTRKNLRQFFYEFDAAPEFAFDIETTGLFPYDRKGAIRCIAFALSNRAWLLPLEGVDPVYRNAQNDFRGRPRVQKAILEALMNSSRGKVISGQNAKFDNHWLEVYYGVQFHLSFDVMLASHILDENSDHDLKSLVRGFLDEPDYDLSTKEKQGFTGEMKLYEYCAKDAAYTLRLKRIFDAKFKKDRILRRLFYKLVMPAARALSDIELVGLTVDLEGLAKTERETREQHVIALQKLNSMAGKEINWNSPQQIAKLLFEDLGLEPTVFTDKGKPSTGEEALLDLKDTHPLATQLVHYRELEKFLSTYIDGWKSYMVKDQLFMSYKLHGTVTGRYSSRLHQIPRDGRIRNLITAPPGWVFVQADISQAEVRTVATISGDLELIKCFSENIDVHWRTLTHSLQAGGAGEYVEHAIKSANLYCLRHKLPPDRTSSEILSEVWNSNPKRERTEKLLQLCRQEWKDQTSGSRQWGNPNRKIESPLERRSLTQSLKTNKNVSPLLLGLWRYKEAFDSSQKRESKGEQTLQFGDAVSLMSSISPSIAQELWTGWKEARKKAKGTVFGYIFGMYPKKFIEYAKMKYGFEPTMKEAETLRAAFFNLYRGLKPWHDSQKKLVHLNGYVRSLSGRMRRLPGIHSSDKMLRMECERQAINSPVQGFIGDYKAMCLVEIHETVPRAKFKLVGEHHDALLGIVRNDSIEEILPQIYRIMKHPKLLDEFKIELTVPMESEIELGPWGAGTPWHPQENNSTSE